jgi:hypothetical protein
VAEQERRRSPGGEGGAEGELSPGGEGGGGRRK